MSLSAPREDCAVGAVSRSRRRRSGHRRAAVPHVLSGSPLRRRNGQPEQMGKWDQRYEAEMLTGAQRRYRKCGSDKSSRISSPRTACRERSRTAAAAIIVS